MQIGSCRSHPRPRLLFVLSTYFADSLFVARHCPNPLTRMEIRTYGHKYINKSSYISSSPTGLCVRGRLREFVIAGNCGLAVMFERGLEKKNECLNGPLATHQQKTRQTTSRTRTRHAHYLFVVYSHDMRT